MAVRDILLLGNPLLRNVALPVNDIDGENIPAIVNDLRDTLIDHRSRRGAGRGIAAPQISQPKRIIYIGLNEDLVMINPEILKSSSEMMTVWDDCFSLPGLIVKVKRHKKITVRFRDLGMEEKQITLQGSISELVQHEIDHLDGVLMIDRATDSRDIMFRSEYEKIQAMEP